MWIKEAQRSDTNAIIKNNGPFLDENGVWRYKRRLRNTHIQYESKHPIWLHKNHSVVTLIINEAHVDVGHNGLRETINQVR